MEQRNSKLETRNSLLEKNIENEDRHLHELSDRHEGVAHRCSEAKLKTASLRERWERADQQFAEASEEKKEAETKASQATTETTALVERLASLKIEQAELATLIDRCSVQGSQLEGQVEAIGRKVTDHRVALARCEQRRDGLRHQTQQLHHDHQEHDRALLETRDRETEACEQGRQLEQSVLSLGSELAELYHEKETLTAEIEQQNNSHESRRRERSQVVRQVDGLREKLLECQSHWQQIELSLQQLDHQRGDLATRMKDDYAIELAVLAAEVASRQSAVGSEDRSAMQNTADCRLPTGDSREAIEAEIAQLKQKTTRHRPGQPRSTLRT